ncbi:MAG: alpha-mannosidase, partial [Bacilli bacterium]|nr:alpha-mannosidase [Bacilli bacterium]
MIQPNVEQLVGRAVSTLGEAIRISFTPLNDVYITDEVGDTNELPLKANWKFFPVPHLFFEQNKYYWLKTEFDVPETDADHEYRFCAYTYIDNHVASTIRPQGLLYLNEEIVQGIDVNHTEVYLKAGHYSLLMLFYTHQFGGNIPLDFGLSLIDKRSEKAFYDLSVPYECMMILDKKNEDYIRTMPILEKARLLLDFRHIHSDEYYKSLEEFESYMDGAFYKGICGSDKTVKVIGHTHIDVAWLWDYAQTREKAKRSFSTVLKLMDEYPEYKFVASTPQVYQFVKEDCPELYKKIKAKQKEGRWEAEGALWVECDCNLTSGESLVRQIVNGKRFFKEEFGVDSKIVWLPDVFGYSGAMPQIMKKAGVERFVTAKIGWNDTNRFPYDTFDWVGIDGSTVRSYLISTADQCNPRNGIYDITYTTYCSMINANHVLATWNRYSQKDLCKTTFLTMGFGDGGGGVTREMLEKNRRFSYGIPGYPKTETSNVKDTLDQIDREFDESTRSLHRRPRWTGELYFEFHRGTLTSVPYIKKANRETEFMLQNAEELSLIASSLNGFGYPKTLLEEQWKVLGINQFHDVLPGSSIEKVYKDAKQMLDGVKEKTKPVIEKSIKSISDGVKGVGLVVFNPNGFLGTGIVEDNGKKRVVKDIPPFGYRLVTGDEISKEEHALPKDRHLENSSFAIDFSEDGSICSLFDKRANRQIVQHANSINKMMVYEDLPYEYDNWELAPSYQQKAYPLCEKAEFTPFVDGDSYGFDIVMKYGESLVKQRVSLYDGVDRIDFATSIVWKERRQILKALFPLDLLFNEINFDVQFGHVSRTSHSNTSWDAAKFEVCGQKWADASEHDYGVAILNDGKYGYGINENELSLTLVKGGGFPYEGAADLIPDFVYSIYPHKGDYAEGRVIEEAYLLNRPLIANRIRNQGG